MQVPGTQLGGAGPHMATRRPTTFPSWSPEPSPHACSRAPLTLALARVLVGQGARRAAGQALPLVQVEPPLAADAEVLAEAALAGGPAFCNRVRDNPGEDRCVGDQVGSTGSGLGVASEVQTWQNQPGPRERSFPFLALAEVRRH